MEKRDKMGKALHIRGLRQRWMVNSVAPVCVLLILVVILVAAGVSEYYYGSMRRGLEQLPEQQRQILVLRELGGLSYAELAQTLGLEEGTVKSRIFRARKRLCALLLCDGNISDGAASVSGKGGAEK